MNEQQFRQQMLQLNPNATPQQIQAAWNQYQQSQSGASSSTSAADAKVFLGVVPTSKQVQQPFGGKALPDGYVPDVTTVTGKGRNIGTAAQAYQLWWGMTPQQQQAAIGMMNAAGYNVSSILDGASTWTTIVDLAAKQYEAFKTPGSGVKAPMTPWELLMNAAGAGSGAPTKHTTTSSRSTTYSPTQMQAYANSVYQRELGRDATPAEIAGVSPTVTASSTTTTKSGKSNSSVSTSSQGAANIQQELINQAQQNPHYAEYQAATTYMNALQRALGEI